MGPTAVVDRLRGAVDRHDLDALVECFATGYRNETPAHPRRGFTGAAAVRANWERIFAGMPDITATVHRCAVDGGVVWSEWELRGRRHDGASHALAGVIIFGVEGDRIAWGRFYLEPVEVDDGDVRAAVEEFVDGGGR
jgi:limonene-1,2-epoxide hydrolase